MGSKIAPSYLQNIDKTSTEVERMNESSLLMMYMKKHLYGSRENLKAKAYLSDKGETPLRA